MNPELQAIVERMIAANESEDNIALVIKNYKPKVNEPAGVGDYAQAALSNVNKGITQLVSAPLKMAGALGTSFQGMVTGEDVAPEASPLYRAGQAVENWTNETNPVNPNVNETFQGVAQGIGQVAGMAATMGGSVAPTLIQTATKVPGLVEAAIQGVKSLGSQAVKAPGILGGSMAAVPEWEAAKAAGATDEEALAVLGANYFTGLSEALPIGNFLDRINKATGGKILERIKTVGMGGIEEALQEGFQTYMSNAIADKTYDPGRDPMVAVAQAMKVGGLVGLIIPTVGVLAKSHAKDVIGTQVEAEQVKNEVANVDPVINQEIDNAAQAAAQNITNAVQIESSNKVSIQPETGTSQKVEQGISQPKLEETPQAQEESVDLNFKPTEETPVSPEAAAQEFQGFVTGAGPESIDQIHEFADGKFKKRSDFEKFVELYNENNERKITDTESNKVWERLKTPRGSSTDTSRKIQITEMSGLKKQIKDFAKGIREGRLDAKKDLQGLSEQISERLGKAKLKPSTVNSIVKKIGKVNLLNPLKVQELVRYVDNVSRDAEYADKLNKAESLQDQLKKASKSKETFASFRPVLESMGKINLTHLEKIQSIDDYIGKAQEYLDSRKDVKNVQYSPVDLQSLATYVENARIESKLVADELAREALNMEGDFTKEELDYIFGENDEFYENATDAQRKLVSDKLQNVAAYTKMALQEYDSEDPVVDYIKTLEPSELTIPQLKRYIRTVDNIVINNDLSGAGGLESLAKAIEGSKKLQSDKIVGRNLGIIEQGAYNLPNIMKAMFGLTRDASKVRQYIGLNDFIAGASRAKNEKDTRKDEFITLIDRLNKKYGKDVLDRENIIRMGVASYLHGYDQGTDPQLAFQKAKQNMEESIEREKSADIKQGEFVENVYGAFKNANSIDEVKTILKKQFPEANNVMDFFKGMFADIKLKQDRANRIYDNRYAPIVEDYFPRRYVKSSVDKVDINEIADKFDALKVFNASTAFSRNNALPANAVVDLSFVDTMFRKYQDTLMDIYANPGVSHMKAFFELPNSDTALGGQENRQRFMESIKYTVNKEFGTNGYKEGRLSKRIDDISNFFKNSAYIKALGSPLQWAKQSTVLANTFVRLGNPKYFFNTPTDAPIYQYYSIGQRGARLGGLYVDDVIDKKYKIELGNKIADAFGKIYTGLEKQVWSRVTAPLRNADVFSAKKSWGAFFKKYLKENYDVDADLLTSHQQLNDPRYKEAGSYAEQMVGETQISSSVGEGSQFLGQQSTTGKITMALLFPFATYAFNTKSRIINSSKYLATGNKAQRLEAAGAMAGLLAEMAAFNMIAQTIVTQINPYLDSLFRTLFGFEKPDKDEEKQEQFRQQMLMSNIARDLSPSSIQQDLTDAQLKYVNEISADQLREEGYTEEEIKSRVPFYVKSGDNGPLDGSLYAIPLRPFLNNDQYEIDYENDQLIFTNQDGTKKEIPIDGNLENYLIFASIVESLATVGIGLSDITNATERVKKEQVREAKKVFSSRQEIPVY